MRHDVAAKELEEKLQEENLMHDDAIKELKEKIADLEKQIKPSSKVESISNETPSEPEQEETETPQETPTEANMDVRSDPFQDVRVLLKESEPTESEATPEPPKKKKRGFF